MVKQRLRLCFTIVGNSTVNTGFWQFCRFLGFIFVKIPPKFFKKLQNGLWHSKVNVWKGGKFNSLKVSKQITLKWKYFVNSGIPPVIYTIFSFTTLEYWANVYSFRGMKLVKVFCRKNAPKMSKIELLNWYFH